MATKEEAVAALRRAAERDFANHVTMANRMRDLSVDRAWDAKRERIRRITDTYGPSSPYSCAAFGPGDIHPSPNEEASGGNS